MRYQTEPGNEESIRLRQRVLVDYNYSRLEIDLLSPRLVLSMKKIVTTPPVDIALRTMNAEEVRRVRAWFDHLQNWDSDDYVRRRSHSLEEVPDVYVLKTSSDIRIFFRFDGDTVTILDVAKKAAIYTSGHVPEID